MNNNLTLIIIRGLPGSGKSTLANSLKGKIGIIHSTDDKFINKDGIYKHDINKLPQYHLENFMDSVKSMKAKISPIIIDNTNMKAEECKNYVDEAEIHGYDIIVEETQTPWRFLINELEKRNKHNVSREVLEMMVMNYEPLDKFKTKLGIK